MNKFWLFFFLGIIYCQSQTKSKHYTTSNGLPHDITYSLYQDKYGFIWIGTDDGLSKFDGKNFTNYNTNNGLQSNYIIDIEKFTDHELLLATWGNGLQLFNNETKTSKTLSNLPKKLSNILFHHDTIYNHEIYLNNNFWLEKNDTYFRKTITFSNKKETLKEKKEHSKITFPTKKTVINDTLYAYSLANKKNRFSDIFYQKNGVFTKRFHFLKNINITAISYDNNRFIAGSHNKLIFFTHNKIISKENIEINETSIIKIISNGNTLFLLTEDERGFKYAYKYNITTKKVENLIESYSINSTISDILLDHDKNLWLATFGDGLHYINNSNFNIKKIELSKNIIKIGFSNKQTALLTNKSIYLIDTNKLAKEYIIRGFGKDVFVKNDAFHVVSLSFNEKKEITTNVFEQYGNKYFNLENFGEIIVSNVTIKLKKTNKNCSYNKLEFTILDAFEYKESLYFATNNGIYKYLKEKNKLEKDSFLNNKLGKQNINAVKKLNNKIYFGTNNGVWELQDNSVININEKDGLIYNQVKCLTVDSLNRLWIGTQKGLSIYIKDKFINLNTESGLHSSFVSDIKEDKHGIMWIAGNKGVSLINTKASLKKETPPLLYVKKNQFKVDYNIISYNRKNLKTQYNINNGLWNSLPLESGFIDLKNYNPGFYKVLIRSKKIDSDWRYSEKINIKIPFKWYQKWWVIVLLTIIIPTVTIAFISYRLKRTKKRNLKLEKTIQKKEALEKQLISVRDNIAKDFHDDLGNKLARISIFSDILKDEELKIDHQNKDLINQINEDANYIFKGTKDFIFSLKSESNNLEDVITYLSDFGEDYTKHFSIIFKVYKDVNKKIVLPHYWGKQIIFIFKEALTNSVKHSNCKEINYQFKIENDYLIIVCKDNGVGFNINKNKFFSGLSNIRERAKKISCTLDINSVKGKGTSIIFKGKLH